MTRRSVGARLARLEEARKERAKAQGDVFEARGGMWWDVRTGQPGDADLPAVPLSEGGAGPVGALLFQYPDGRAKVYAGIIWGDL